MSTLVAPSLSVPQDSSVSMASTSSMTYSITAPPLPLLPSKENVVPHLNLPPHDLVPLLREALLSGAGSGDVGLVQWLLSLQGDAEHILPVEAEDEDGANLVSLAIMGSIGREDKEECVRLLVKRIGVQGKDTAGWTALHLAALHSTPPLISFLLTSGADPHALTNKGLTALDMICDLSSHTAQAALLTSAMTTPFDRQSLSPALPPSSSAPDPNTHFAAPRKPSPAVIASLARAELIEREGRKDRMRWEKERWITEVAGLAKVDVERLLDRTGEDDPVDKEEEKLKKRKREGRRGRVEKKQVDSDHSDSDSDRSSTDGSDEERYEEEYDPHSPPPYHTFLVFSLPNLPSLLDTLISSYPPNAHPRSWRSAPANTLYLFSRFALYRCDEDWLEELIIGVVDRIEASIYDNVEDLAHLAFWNYNSTLLLHLLRSDAGLEISCYEMGLLTMLEELIGAIHVFVIRVVERRIDVVLDSALLDYESMSEEFGDVAFEGEWNFLKSLTGRGGTAAKKAAGRIVPKARDVFAQAANGGVGTNHDEGAGFGYGSVREARPRGSIDAGNGSSGSGGGNGRPLSVADFRSSVVAGRTSQPLSPSGSYSSGKNPLFSSTSLSLEKSSSQSKPPSSSEITPRTITSFLTSILVILQLYEVNPAITCQAFSQVYYWVGCEAFNRIITRKKYLCRSKAVQIRMNMTALEDWVRESGLPVRTATKHLEPVNQLLQWLQTCSSLREFDNLIVMVQNLKSLNPLQMRRAISDYRFEVGEGKMSDECSQYLAQLQKDWEKRRVRIGVETLQREISGKERARIDKYGDGSNGGPGSPSTHANPPSEDKPYNPSLLEPATPIDSLFDPSIPLGAYNPPGAPECMGELLDSRFMLPFSLPSDIDLLVAAPQPNSAFALLSSFSSANSSKPSQPGAASSTSSPSIPQASPRLSSRSSSASMRPLLYARRPRNSIRELPDDFLDWLSGEEQINLRRDRPLAQRLANALEVSRSGMSIEPSSSSSPLYDRPLPSLPLTSASVLPSTPFPSSSSASLSSSSSQPHRQPSQSWPSVPFSHSNLPDPLGPPIDNFPLQNPVSASFTPSYDEFGMPLPSSSSSSSPQTYQLNDSTVTSSHSHPRSSFHDRGDSERTISSHGKDGSTNTITSSNRGSRQHHLQETSSSSTVLASSPEEEILDPMRSSLAIDRVGRKGGDSPTMPSSPGGWLKKKLTVKARKGSVDG